MADVVGRLKVGIFSIGALIILGAADPDSLRAPSPADVIRYSQAVIAIENVRVIDGTGSPARDGQTVIISHGKIAEVGDASRVAVPSEATVVDGKGRTLTPGFVGTHDHLYYVSGGPLFIMREMPYSFPRLYLAGGVTTIRTAGSVEPYTDLRVKRAVDDGELVGPHMDVTSPYLTGFEPFFIQMGTLRDPADAARTVDFWADRGATSFKLYMQITPGEARAVINEAHARHLRVLGHLCTIGFTQAAEMGIDSLEHGLFEDTEFIPGRADDSCPSASKEQRESLADLSTAQMNQLIKTLVAHHVAISSTIAAYESGMPNRPPLAVQDRNFKVLDAESKQDVLATRARISSESASTATLVTKAFEQEQDFETAFYKAGGLLTQGPDPTGYGATIAGFGDQRDIELLVHGGLTPVQAIRVATLNGARALGRDDHIGSITVGKDADLVLIRGNPAKEIRDIENVEVVFKDGVGYDSQKIIESVRGIAGRQ